MSPILKLGDHDEEKEIEFELDYLLSLTLQERFQLMFKKTKELIELSERNGHRRPDSISKRTSTVGAIHELSLPNVQNP